MRVITTSGTRSVNIIPRYVQTVSVDYQITLYNENTRQSNSLTAFTYTLTSYTNNNGQIELTFTDSYAEGDSLSYYVTDTTNNRIAYRGKLFVTDQTPQNYSINE